MKHETPLIDVNVRSRCNCTNWCRNRLFMLRASSDEIFDECRLYWTVSIFAVVYLIRTSSCRDCPKWREWAQLSCRLWPGLCVPLSTRLHSTRRSSCRRITARRTRTAHSPLHACWAHLVANVQRYSSATIRIYHYLLDTPLHRLCVAWIGQ